MCRVGERPRQDIETPLRFGRSVGHRCGRACCELHLKKRKRTLRKAENSAGYHYLCFRFSLASSTFRLQSTNRLTKLSARDRLIFTLSLSIDLLLSILAFLPAGMHAVIEIFMDQVSSFPLTYHLPLRHFLLTFSEE